MIEPTQAIVIHGARRCGHYFSSLCGGMICPCEGDPCRDALLRDRRQVYVKVRNV